jgi:hypothetical protein
MHWKLEPSLALGSSVRIGFWISVGLALLVAIVLVHEIRDGHDWGDDFSLYISHARNIVEGRPYAQTGYIVNPYFRIVSPDTYPPLFPLLLAPLYSRFGLDFFVFKLPGILCFAASIPVLFCLARRDLSAGQSLLAAGLWAGWPFMLWMKDNVLPDLLFVLLMLLALWLLRVACDEFPRRDPVSRAVLIGVLCYAAYATRSAGVVLPAAIAAYEVLRYRSIRRFAICVLGVFGVLAVAQNLLIHKETTYLQMFTVAPAETATIYLHSLTALFSTDTTGWLQVVRYTATFAAVLLAGLGFLIQLRRFRSPAEFVVAIYAVLLLLWSAGAGTRYMIPLIPFFFLYLVTALDMLRRSLSSPQGLGLETAVIALILICYVAQDREYQPGPIQDGILTPGFAELCQYITANTNPGDIFVFAKPRALSLFTRRPASIYPAHGPPDLIWRYSLGIHARYFVVTDFLGADATVLRPFVQEYGDRLGMIFSNSNFRLYAILN